MRIPTARYTDVATAAGKRILALCLVLAPALAQAHPGLAGDGLGAGLLHPLHGLDHVLAALAVGVWAARLQGRALYALPIAFVTAMAGGASLALAGFGLPGMEPMLAVSVLVLGALVGCDARIPTSAGLALIAAFAPFHGAAHAAEMPAAGAVFVLGVLIATALLHAAGGCLALALRGRPSWLRTAALPVMFAGLAMLVARVSA
jgi:urease accessory protein